MEKTKVRKGGLNFTIGESKKKFSPMDFPFRVKQTREIFFSFDFLIALLMICGLCGSGCSRCV
jgi:hypothetical protein